VRRAEILSLCFLVAAAFPAAAHLITITGGWNLVLDGTMLSGPAGSDFLPSYSSDSNALVIDITGTIDQFDDWAVDVHKTDVSWDGSLTISVVRTTDGMGPGDISGGTAATQVSDTASRFFQGTGDRSSVHVQLLLEGASVTLGEGTRSVQITFTLLDAP